MALPDERFPPERAPAGGFQRDGYANPEGSSPAPAPDAKLRPVGYYERLASVSWSGRTATWNTTVLDLRSDLRGVSSRPLLGTPVNRVSALQLFVSISGLQGIALGMEAAVAHFGHPIDGEVIRRLTPWIDITGDIATGTDIAVVPVFPPGSGYQMRYWQLHVRFRFEQTPTTRPPLRVEAGMY